MASIEFRVLTTSGELIKKTAAVADDDVGRLVAWAVATLSMPNDAKGAPVSERSAEWAIGRWIEIVLSDALAATEQFERTMAVSQVHEKIKPIQIEIK